MTVLDQSSNEQRGKKPRRDKGTRLLTSRDVWVLRWIGEQYCARFDQVQQLLSRQPLHRDQAKAPGPGGLTASAVGQVLARWQQDPAYVQYERVYVERPGWIWLTPYGERALDLPYARHTLRESRLTHRYYINLVRLDYEARHPGAVWTSERAILAQLPQRNSGEAVPHVPDGIITCEDGRGAIAIEVELSPKKDAELDTVLAGLIGGDRPRYRSVWYFVSDQDPVHIQAWRAVAAARERLPIELQKRMQLIDLVKVGVRQS